MPEPTRADRLAGDRDRLEAAMVEADARALPALVREHRAVLAELDKLATAPKGSIVDELKRRREEREAGAAGPAASEVRL